MYLISSSFETGSSQCQTFIMKTVHNTTFRIIVLNTRFQSHIDLILSLYDS